MIMSNIKLKEQIKDFYFGKLLDTFPAKAHDTIKAEFNKHLFELSVVLQSAVNNDPKVFLDVGGGLGINAIILAQLFGYRCRVIDRLEEFRAEHNRVVGDKISLVARLNKFGVEVDEVNFMEDAFPYKAETFTVITCFDVIEHLLTSPKTLVANITGLLKPSGVLLIGTPNQVHLYNRLKAIIGKNTWEDFEYYYNSKIFYGHIRELVPHELEQILRREPALDFDRIVYSNFPFEDRRPELVAKYGRILTCALLKSVFILAAIFPDLNYDMIAVAQKNNENSR